MGEVVRGGGLMRGLGPGTDHVTSGPISGLEKNAPYGADTQTSGNGDSMTAYGRH